jgi:hypothetical protein
MRARGEAINGELFKDKSRRWHAYEGPLGEVVHIGQYFFAWRDGFRIGRYDTLEEAMEALAR